jgi:hypothetical protein
MTKLTKPNQSDSDATKAAKVATKQTKGSLARKSSGQTKTRPAAEIDGFGDDSPLFAYRLFELMRAHYKETMEYDQDIVDTLTYLIRDMLYLFADFDCEMNQLHQKDHEKGYPRLSCYDAAIRRLRGELKYRSKGDSGYVGADRAGVDLAPRMGQ